MVVRSGGDIDKVGGNGKAGYPGGCEVGCPGPAVQEGESPLNHRELRSHRVQAQAYVGLTVH